MESTEHKWQHLKIRAEKEGILLSASTGIREMDVGGLDTLTLALAKGVLGSLGTPSPEQLVRAQAAVLKTLLHQWGTKSYEFALTAKPEPHLNPFDDDDYDEEDEEDGEDEGRMRPKKKNIVCRAYSYFGTKRALAGHLEPDRVTQDSFPHVKAYMQSGGSASALAFFRQHQVSEDDYDYGDDEDYDDTEDYDD